VFENADGGGTGHRIEDFASGGDEIRLDGSGNMSALGASGNFSAADPRFHAAAGAIAGHDADDRVIYNTTTGELFYDADGSGSGAAMHIATLQAGANVVATDIEVANSTAPVGGQTINGTANNDTLVGGAGNDTMNGNAGADLIQGQGGNDSLLGSTGWDTLQGGDGNDWLHGDGWSDTMTGGAGSDSFVWNDSGNNTRDTVTDFASGMDELLFDNAAMTALGANGAWAAGDGRFWAAAGATGGHDADDRLVYNTSNGNLYYDADGSGAGAAQVVATFQGGVSISASDITVI
jgi:Ca2+-binding RTX toxin-like protein